MFRVAKHLPLVVVSPQPWSPFDWMIRLARKSFRPMGKVFEVVDDIEIHRPRVLCFPAIFKRFDGVLMAHGSRSRVNKIVADFKPTIIDAHFAYPDGFAAAQLAKQHHLKLTITLRGSKDEWLIGTSREPQLREALSAATQLFAVSDSLKRDVAQKLLGPNVKCTVVGNGVDLVKFERVDKHEARRKLQIAQDADVVIGVGSLIERKGFHRVIPLIQSLKLKYPKLIYLIVGGGATHGDLKSHLTKLAREHGVEENVIFCGSQLPSELKWFYGAADVFALATEHEGWANVFLEAMACGLPVISTLVGGNSQVVCNDSLGTLTPYWHAENFERALDAALTKTWDRDQICAYAQSNSWDARITQLLKEFRQLQVAA
jgi:teichuronic acid biosynthesis glycosyltransferase TuaC